MKTILVVADVYIPGSRGGGPIRSIAHLVEWLGDELHFLVMTRDRDLGSTEPYPDIIHGKWQPVGKAEVLYLEPACMNWLTWATLLRGLDYDILYLNSLFSFTSIKTLVLARLGVVPPRPTVLAPRGELSPGALAIKPMKKQLFLKFASALRIYDTVVWQASSEYEKQDILRVFGPEQRVRLAPNLGTKPGRIHISSELPPQSVQQPVRANLHKQPGHLRLVFVSRISRKKNLDGALAMLQSVTGFVEFDIFGPQEDVPYWTECEKIASSLPKNVTVHYGGELQPADVIATLQDYHVLLFPTYGENFGHVILEALTAGCLVLTSDLTPWRGLTEKRVGWDISLNRAEMFDQALTQVIAMDSDTFSLWSNAAVDYSRSVAANEASIQSNRRLFLGQ